MVGTGSGAAFPAGVPAGLETIDLSDWSLYATLATRFGLEIERGRRLLAQLDAFDHEACALRPA